MYRAGKLCLIPGYSYFCGEDLFQCKLRSWWNIQPQFVYEHIVGGLDDRVGSPEKPGSVLVSTLKYMRVELAERRLLEPYQPNAHMTAR
jgi:hypothetical protein